MKTKTINPWRHDWNPELRGTTGRIFEREVLGECKVRCQGYLKFYRALDEVVRNQPGNTFEPAGEVANFHGAVAREMRSMGFNPYRLQIFTAVGSALDRFHDIDGFFSFDGTIVTVDVTMNPHKDVCRARVLVTAEDALVGYPQAAFEIAGWFNHAKRLRRKGVV